MMKLLMAADASGAAATGIMGLMAGFYGVMMVFYCLILLVALIGFLFWLWMLIDALSRKNYDTDNERLLWCLVVFLGSWIGAVIYYFLVKRKKDNEPPTPVKEAKK